jgi:hypothetical protein
MYAKNTMGFWETEVVDTGDCSGVYNSLAIDSNGKAHISYDDHINYNLKYATNASGSWVVETVDSTGIAGWYNSLALDSNDKVHISYYGDGNLKYATNASGSWITETVDTTGGSDTSLALDSNDKVHISYRNTLDYDLKYATNAIYSWSIETVDSTVPESEFISLDTSLALDSNDKVHISYHDVSHDNLKYATNASGSWVKEILDSAGRVGSYNSLAIDSDDKVHISYYGNGKLKCANNVYGTWITESIDNTSGFDTSIALDANNKVHISYHDGVNGDLKYALQYCEIPDSDEDCVSDSLDNCPSTPNGPDLGTCTKGTIGQTCMSNGECGTGGLCSMNQEDTDEDGIGDACEPCLVEQIYGEHSEVSKLLRHLRDNVLSQTPEGQELIRLYYELSSTIVKAMEEDEEFREEVKEMIDGVLELIEIGME